MTTNAREGVDNLLHVLDPIVEGNRTQEVVGNAERIHQGDRVRQQLSAQLVDLELDCLNNFDGEVTVDHEPGCVLIHSPERVQSRQLVHYFAQSSVLVQLV